MCNDTCTVFVFANIEKGKSGGAIRKGRTRLKSRKNEFGRAVRKGVARLKSRKSENGRAVRK